jgi:hypothetical protein
MATAAGFNKYVQLSVDMLLAERTGGGYDLHSYFTQPLVYGHDKYVKSNHPPKTMCVAAVCETIIEALNIYAKQTGDYEPFAKLPMRSWNGGSRKDIRAYIFQYDEVKCDGAAHALSIFGIGEQLPFQKLLPGDFVTLNRTTGSGHSTVFLGFINKDFGDEPVYSKDVVGFKYFSAQGKGKPDAGFARRWGVFSPHKPTPVPGRPPDYNIIRSDDPKLLNTGRMFMPADWNVDQAAKRLRSDYFASRSAEILEKSSAKDDLSDTSFELVAGPLIDREMSRELPPSVPQKYDRVSDSE